MIYRMNPEFQIYFVTFKNYLPFLPLYHEVTDSPNTARKKKSMKLSKEVMTELEPLTNKMKNCKCIARAK